MENNASYLRFDHLLVGKHPLIAPNTKLLFHRRRTVITGWGGAGKSTLARLLTEPVMPDFVLRQMRCNISIPHVTYHKEHTDAAERCPHFEDAARSLEVKTTGKTTQRSAREKA